DARSRRPSGGRPGPRSPARRRDACGGRMTSRVLTRLSGPLPLSFAGSAGIQALNAVTGIIGARALGPHGRGELAALLIWPLAISSLGSLGLSDALAFHAAQRTAP